MPWTKWSDSCPRRRESLKTRPNRWASSSRNPPPDVPGWVAQNESKLVVLLTDRVGLSREQAEKAAQTIKAHAGEWMENIGAQAPGVAPKAKDAVAGLFGKK